MFFILNKISLCLYDRQYDICIWNESSIINIIYIFKICIQMKRSLNGFQFQIVFAEDLLS